MKHQTRSIFVLAALLSPAWALAADIDETRSVASDSTVSVSNVAGSIDISTWDRAEVRLTGQLGNDQELEIIENDGGIQIEVRNIDDEDDYDETNLKLVMPFGASLVADGVSADITVDGVDGASIVAESVSGDIDVSAGAGRVELSSVSGDVDFEGTAIRTSVESVSGDIDVSGISGEIAVSTVSGDAELDAENIAEGQFDTVSGTLQLKLSVTSGGRVSVETMSGDVTLLLPANQGGTITAQGFSGDIRSEFGEVKNESYGPGSHLKYVSGDSGTTIRVESFSGDIRIGHK
jgi:hypothetical protein